MSALGIPIQIRRDQHLARSQFYLGLADALNCVTYANSVHFRELADSFSHDVLNIAALAGRLLWYEGVTPEIWRSHDLIAVGLDAEAYYVMLQSACDIMADVIATLGAKKGQAPWESFHKLNEWALKNRERLDPSYRSLIATKLPWFGRINSTRTAIVHRGKTLLVYTDRVSFNWGTLIREFRDITRSMLAFSERLGATMLDEKVREKHSQKTVIDGVYVPALYHLLNEYSVPKKSSVLKLHGQCLLACGGYVEAAYIGYPDGFWWNTLISSVRSMRGKLITVKIPVNADGSVNDCKFVISAEKRTFGIIACDSGGRESAWLAGAAESAKKFESENGIFRMAFIVREMKSAPPKFVPNTKIPVIVGKDPSVVAQTYARAMLD